MQALRLPSVKRVRRLLLMFLICENDCSHAYVEPNMVNTAILTRCIVWYVTGSSFQVLRWSSAGLQVEDFSFLSICVPSPALLAVAQDFPTLH